MNDNTSPAPHHAKNPPRHHPLLNAALIGLGSGLLGALSVWVFSLLFRL